MKDCVLSKIDSLKSLAVRPEVAVRLIDLGKDPEAELQDYVSLIESDTGLASKLIAYSNTSWFSPRYAITTVKRAVGMLGTTNVRSLAISYCVEGLHSRLKLERDDARAIWQASLCKASAAKLIAGAIDPAVEDEAFALALLQDVGVGLLAACDGESYVAALRQPGVPVEDQLALERELFGADHAEVGVRLARNLGLPEPYREQIEHHHAEPGMEESPPASQRAARLVAVLPHDMRAWHPEHLEPLHASLEAACPGHWPDGMTFLEQSQEQYQRLSGMLRESENDIDLVEALREMTAEAAEYTGHLVGQIQHMAEHHDRLTKLVDDVLMDQVSAEQRARHDALTSLYNRAGFIDHARDVIAHARENGLPLGVLIFDIDNFKQINDHDGHNAGDEALKAMAQRLRGCLEERDLACRWGGDEIVVLLPGRDREACIRAARRIKGGVEALPIQWNCRDIYLSISGGLRYVADLSEHEDLTDLVEEADHKLYSAKTTRKGTIITH